MAFTSTKNLGNNSTTILADWQHADHMFNVDQFRLSPKFKFLFHVAFSINTAALKNSTLVQRYGNEINMLVKSIDLPSYTPETEVLNQYNRKKVVQVTHKHGNVKVKFHDDNMGLINQLWQSYYSYYYADSTSGKSSGAYARNATRSSNFITTPYGLDNKSSNPFFNYIKIYQMARHEYVEYKLLNPVITSWNHNNLTYSDSKPHEFDMALAYEAVTYDHGAVTQGNPEGFGITHYDNDPSPLSGAVPDPSVFSPSFVQAMNMELHAPNILNNAITTVNAYQNTKSPLANRGQVGLSMTGPLQTNSGLNGIAMPQSSAQNNTTVATQVNI